MTKKQNTTQPIVHYGSIEVKQQKSRARFSGGKQRFETLIDHGYTPPEWPGAVKVGFFNANPFAKGIANLGYQCIADYLLQREVNVYFAFADTIQSDSFFLNNRDITPLDCDLIAISVPFEDTYLEVLRCLDRAGLPIYARERGNDSPLIIAGGMAMINPMPLHDFVDVFIIGEGREALYEITQRYERHQTQPWDKAEFLWEIADIPGVYIPSHYHIKIDKKGYVDEFTAINGHDVVEANTPLDMNQHPIYSIWTSKSACYEYDDYFSLMTAMGCHKKCPFCVVGHIQGYKSGRAMNINIPHVIDLAKERRDRYGTDLVKLFFSSAFSEGKGDINSDSIKSLLRALLPLGFQARVGSLNVQQSDEELFDLLKHHGNTNATFAPETVESLRITLNKGYITDEKLHTLAHLCSKYDMDMTLYMLGCLPGENDGHTLELSRLIRSIRRTLKSNCRLEIHYNQSFMKAQTPYQYFGCVRPEEIRRKYKRLRDLTSDLENVLFVTVINDPMSYYQPILALGDLNAGRVLAHLYQKPECPEVLWRTAFHELGLDDQRYFSDKDPDKQLPWEHISHSSHQRLKKRFAYYGRKKEVLQEFSQIQTAH